MEKRAVIKKCPEKDIDPDRPRSEQKICLYTHDGSRLLGRHPDRESAMRQERLIQMKKHGKFKLIAEKTGKAAPSDFEGHRQGLKSWIDVMIDSWTYGNTGQAFQTLKNIQRQLKIIEREMR